MSARSPSPLRPLIGLCLVALLFLGADLVDGPDEPLAARRAAADGPDALRAEEPPVAEMPAERVEAKERALPF